jgi:putative membrane protein
MASVTSLDVGHRLQIERASGPLGRYDGLVLVLIGLALIVAATVRFVRTGRRLDDEETHPAGSLRAELILSAVLALVVAGVSAYLVLG